MNIAELISKRSTDGNVDFLRGAPQILVEGFIHAEL